MTETMIPSLISNPICEKKILNLINGYLAKLLPLSSILIDSFVDEIEDSAFDASEIDMITDRMILDMRDSFILNMNEEGKAKRILSDLMRYADAHRDI